jgi:hypothetical protein
MALGQLPEIKTLDIARPFQLYQQGKEYNRKLQEIAKRTEREDQQFGQQQEEYEYEKSRRPFKEKTEQVRLDEIEQDKKYKQEQRITAKQGEVQEIFSQGISALNPDDEEAKANVFNIVEEKIKSAYHDGNVPPAIDQRLRKMWDNLTPDTIRAIQKMDRSGVKKGSMVPLTSKDGYEVEVPYGSPEYDEMIRVGGYKPGRKAKVANDLLSVPRGGSILNRDTGEVVYEDPRGPAGAEQPSAVREWENYIKLSPEEREMYLTMKRAQQNIDLGGRVVQPSMGVPGQVAGEFEKTLPPEKTPQAIGEAETAKRQAELAAEKKKMYPKARETKISLERQWDVVSGQIDKAIEKVSPFTAGVGSVASVIPATPQRDLRETLATIRANIGFDKLQDMRNNSPTGGALGQVSDTENKLLQAVQGSLDQGQSPAQLRENLVNIKTLMNEIKEQKKTAFATDFGEVESGSSPQTGPAKISSDADYDSLPSGTEFIAPDGSRRRKP